MLDKYGTGQDPYCFPGTSILRNLQGLHDEQSLAEAERALTEIAAQSIDFTPPPYTLTYLQDVHRQLFADLYDWAGELRTVDISKDDTHFCTTARIEPEAQKLFEAFALADWYQGLGRQELVTACAVLFGDLNVVHPFREGNGRALRILFEHIIVNAGYEISWWAVEPREWIQANINAVFCDYALMEMVFERCIGQPIEIDCNDL